MRRLIMGCDEAGRGPVILGRPSSAHHPRLVGVYDNGVSNHIHTHVARPGLLRDVRGVRHDKQDDHDRPHLIAGQPASCDRRGAHGIKLRLYVGAHHRRGELRWASGVRGLQLAPLAGHIAFCCTYLLPDAQYHSFGY